MCHSCKFYSAPELPTRMPHTFQDLVYHSHYRWYVPQLPQLEVLLGTRTAYKDATYLPRFGVSFTLQVVCATVGSFTRHQNCLQGCHIPYKIWCIIHTAGGMCHSWKFYSAPELPTRMPHTLQDLGVSFTLQVVCATVVSFTQHQNCLQGCHIPSNIWCIIYIRGGIICGYRCWAIQLCPSTTV